MTRPSSALPTRPCPCAPEPTPRVELVGPKATEGQRGLSVFARAIANGVEDDVAERVLIVGGCPV
jgi:hypothetical protein